MILIFALPDDPSYQLISKILKTKKIDHVRLHWSEYPKEFSLSFIDTKAFLRFANKLDLLDLSKITTVWEWRTGSRPTSFSHFGEYSAFYCESFTVIRNALYHYMPNAYYLQDPALLDLAENKIIQLDIAKKVNLKIPSTYIGNSPHDAKTFMLDFNYIALKQLTYFPNYYKLNMFSKLLYHFLKKLLNLPFVKAFKIQFHFPDEKDLQFILASEAFTKKIACNDLANRLELLQLYPEIIQEYIEKKIELRVTIVNNKIFSAAIHSQESKLTSIDWRAGYNEKYIPKHEKYQLPKHIEDKCIEFLKLQGLTYGAMDFIVTPEGDYIFLENNPFGQWLWIQEALGYPIAETIVETLLSKAKPPPATAENQTIS